MSRPNLKRNRANRQNAQKSTGPRTTEGKNRSRWNALTHGLLAQSVVLPDCEELESPEQFQELLTDLTYELNPLGIREGMLVEQIAVSYWRLRRALRMEAGSIAKRVETHNRFEGRGPVESVCLPIPDRAHLIIRYETAIDRRLTRTQNTLERLQSSLKGGADEGCTVS